MREEGSGSLRMAPLLEGPWSICFAVAMLLTLALAATFPPAATEGAQMPPIGVGITAPAGWEEAPADGTAAVVLRRRDGGRVIGVLNVVITEGEMVERAAITDPGVAEGLEQELLGAVPGARPRARVLSKVGEFNALSVTIDVVLDGRAKVLRQTTVDVRRGAVTVTVVADAPQAEMLLAEADGIVGGMVIDAVR